MENCFAWNCKRLNLFLIETVFLELLTFAKHCFLFVNSFADVACNCLICLHSRQRQNREWCMMLAWELKYGCPVTISLIIHFCQALQESKGVFF